MRVIGAPSQLVDLIGEQLGPSDWLLVTQDMIDRFAGVTGDRQWIHVDPERAAREAPNGVTIAHGFLTLSLLPALQESLYSIDKVDRILNYGLDRLRFISPAPAGARIRLLQTIDSVEPLPQNGWHAVFRTIIEIEGSERPALAAQAIALIYEAADEAGSL